HAPITPSPTPYHSSPLFFFHSTATTDIYTLSLHDALPISLALQRTGEMGSFYPTLPARAFYPRVEPLDALPPPGEEPWRFVGQGDRKSTRLNSSHDQISYAVFCLKKKKTKAMITSNRQ